ncbi:MAG: type II secretion system protein M [Gammaproteobacteria bacterium]|nr:type II secretion system protein M [Gammaproteobacteria bacterium]
MAKSIDMQDLRKKVGAMSEREKWMLVITGFVLVVGILDFFIIQPMRDQRALFEQQINTVRSQQADFAQQQEELVVQIESDPAMVMQRQIEGLEKSIDTNEVRLKEFTTSLVTPVEMSNMLRELVNQNKGLKLIELENQAVAPLIDDAENQEDMANENETEFGLFRHPVKVIFEGNYKDTLAYVQKLENIDNKFYWQRFDYQVLEYPKARVTINIYTLSTQQWWIGSNES